jgi:ubiquinone biosynthesis accessory factor UbiJ
MFSLALQSLETALNAYLALDPETKPKLQKLQGKMIKLVIQDWNISFYIVVNTDRLQLHQTIESKPDTTIIGKLDALLRVGCSGGKNTALFKNHIEIEGDSETGEKIQSLLAEMDIDWEEHLSKLIGDIGAHKIGTFFSQLKQTSKQACQTLETNFKEFLQLELKLLPQKAEVQQFNDDVSKLRHDVERMEARINHLLAARNKAS